MSLGVCGAAWETQGTWSKSSPWQEYLKFHPDHEPEPAHVLDRVLA